MRDRRPPNHSPSQTGFTLIEVLMTIVIIGILASVALRSVQGGIESSRIRATQDEMDGLAWAIAGNPDLLADGMRSDFGYVGDVGALPSSLDDLVTNPGGYTTWNGPYISRRFTQDAVGFKQDAWGNDYTFTGGITIASTGDGSTPMTKSVAATVTELTNNVISGTVSDAVGNPPGDSCTAFTITVIHPDGTGGTTTSSTSPATDGSYAISGIPVGVHAVQAVYRATNDTMMAIACVLPKTGTVLGLQLPSGSFVPADGGASGAIKYVKGSAGPTGQGKATVLFDITNTSTDDVSINWLIANYLPSVYFNEVRWNTPTAFRRDSPHAHAGKTCHFSSARTIAPGETVTVRFWRFRDQPVGGNLADVSNVHFAVRFSDGSAIDFISGS